MDIFRRGKRDREKGRSVSLHESVLVAERNRRTENALRGHADSSANVGANENDHTSDHQRFDSVVKRPHPSRTVSTRNVGPGPTPSFVPSPVHGSRKHSRHSSRHDSLRPSRVPSSSALHTDLTQSDVPMNAEHSVTHKIVYVVPRNPTTAEMDAYTRTTRKAYDRVSEYAMIDVSFCYIREHQLDRTYDTVIAMGHDATIWAVEQIRNADISCGFVMFSVLGDQVMSLSSRIRMPHTVYAVTAIGSKDGRGNNYSCLVEKLEKTIQARRLAFNPDITPDQFHHSWLGKVFESQKAVLCDDDAILEDFDISVDVPRPARASRTSRASRTGHASRVSHALHISRSQSSRPYTNRSSRSSSMSRPARPSNRLSMHMDRPETRPGSHTRDRFDDSDRPSASGSNSSSRAIGSKSPLRRSRPMSSASSREHLKKYDYSESDNSTDLSDLSDSTDSPDSSDTYEYSDHSDVDSVGSTGGADSAEGKDRKTPKSDSPSRSNNTSKSGTPNRSNVASGATSGATSGAASETDESSGDGYVDVNQMIEDLKDNDDNENSDDDGDSLNEIKKQLGDDYESDWSDAGEDI